MPIYEYRCENCEDEFEELVSFSERERPVNEPCPSCGKDGKENIRIKISKGSYHSQDVIYKDPYGRATQVAQNSMDGVQKAQRHLGNNISMENIYEASDITAHSDKIENVVCGNVPNEQYYNINTRTGKPTDYYTKDADGNKISIPSP